jgi:hypothetical protein
MGTPRFLANWLFEKSPKESRCETVVVAFCSSLGISLESFWSFHVFSLVSRRNIVNAVANRDCFPNDFGKSHLRNLFDRTGTLGSGIDLLLKPRGCGILTGKTVVDYRDDSGVVVGCLTFAGDYL